MAVPANMTVLADTLQIQRLTLRLIWYAYKLHHTVMDISNYRDSARVVSETILALLDLLDIYSIPGSEWQRFDELRKQCAWVDSLLLIGSSERDTLHDKCIEAITQYCYLLEMVSIRRAALIERLCLGGDDTWATTMTTTLNS